MLTRSLFIRGFVVVFSIVTGVGLIYAGPMSGYQYVEFHHCWLHLTLSVIGLFAALTLKTARIFLVFSSIIFFALAMAGFMTHDHFMHMNFNPMVDYIHLGVGIILLGIGALL